MAADIKAETLKTSWGLSVTCSAGTSVPVSIFSGEDRLSIQGIYCGGAATTDITTVQDASGKIVFKGAAVVNTMNGISFPKSISVSGLMIGFAGATTGYCNIYYGN